MDRKEGRLFLLGFIIGCVALGEGAIIAASTASLTFMNVLLFGAVFVLADVVVAILGAILVLGLLSGLMWLSALTRPRHTL